MSKPRVIATLLARDEQDIIINCIEHHLRHGVDGFIITDNRSRDLTGSLCAKHPACLHFIQEPGKHHKQSKWVTRMARLAARRYDADWVLNLDADEFWYGADYLEEIPKNVNEIVLYKKYTHHIHTEITYGAFSRHLVPYARRAAVESNKGKTIHRASRHITVHFGNHSVEGPWGTRGVISDDHLPAFYFHHYPARSYKRMKLKCKNAGSRAAAKPRTDDARWTQLWYLYKDNKMREAYAASMLTAQQLTDGLATNKIVKVVPTDELPIEELAKRSYLPPGRMI